MYLQVILTFWQVQSPFNGMICQIVIDTFVIFRVSNHFFAAWNIFALSLINFGAPFFTTNAFKTHLNFIQVRSLHNLKCTARVLKHVNNAMQVFAIFFFPCIFRSTFLPWNPETLSSSGLFSFSVDIEKLWLGVIVCFVSSHTSVVLCNLWSLNSALSMIAVASSLNFCSSSMESTRASTGHLNLKYLYER